MTGASSLRELESAVVYPRWIKAHFYGGLGLLVISSISVAVSVFVPSMPGLDILMLPALAGLAALQIVSVYGERLATPTTTTVLAPSAGEVDHE